MDFKPFKIGKYLLLEKIATGGMAEVYRAKASGAGGFEKQLAIKRILPNYASNDEFRRMFEYEARLSSMLTHANIAQIYDFVKASETYLLAMEFIDGKNLRQFINKAKKVNYVPPVEFGLFIINEVCKGLEYAHKRKDDLTGKPLNVIHRDMSPQNIMLSYDGAVKIVDFGIAKAKDRVDETRSGVIKGKFGYMSPEQANGEQIDHRTDIFSTGIILHELLTNRRLFAGDNDMATLRQIQECVIPSATRLNPKVTPELEKILMKALTKDLTLRYQGAGLFHRNIQEYLNRHFTAFSQREMSDILTKVFADEIVAEKKRFEAVYRQSIPFSQKAQADGEGNIDDSFQEPGESDEPATKSETRNASIVTNLSGEEIITSISGVFSRGKSNPRVESDSPLTKVEVIVPEEEGPITGASPLRTDPSLKSSTQVKTGSTFGRTGSKTFGGPEKTQVTGSNPLNDRGERPTQVTDNKFVPEPREKTANGEPSSPSGVSLSDTAAGAKGRRRDRSISMSRDLSTGGTGQGVSLQSYAKNELETLDSKMKEQRAFTDPYAYGRSKRGNPFLKFFLLLILLGMGALYLKENKREVGSQGEEEPRVPSSTKPKRIQRRPQTAPVEPDVESVPGEAVAPTTEKKLTPKAYGDCAMEVVSDPPGATIIVDKDIRGVTNSVISGVCGKAYNVTLTLEGYEDYKTNYVFQGKRGNIKRALKKVPMGLLELTITGNAELYIDEQYVGDISPAQKFEKNLRAGQKHRLRFVNKSFKIDVGCTITVQADKVERKMVRLGDGRCE